jgi:hypothetical protein
MASFYAKDFKGEELYRLHVAISKDYVLGIYIFGSIMVIRFGV